MVTTMEDAGPTELIAVENRSHNILKMWSDTIIKGILPFSKRELEEILSLIKAVASGIQQDC
jgi:hypothetical protein